MRANDVWMRCLKARIVSWLNTSHCGAIVPTTDGNGIVIAVYNNGRYVDPEPLHVPNSPADLWGPDGPVYRSQPPPEHPDDPKPEDPDA